MPRLTGKSGSIYLAQSSTKIADTYLWEFEFGLELGECSIKGESFMHYVPNVGSGRVRVQSYLQSSSPLTQPMLADLPALSTGAGTPVNFALFGLDTDQLTTSKVLGSGWIVRSQLHVGRDGLITDEMEIQVDGQYTIAVV